MMGNPEIKEILISMALGHLVAFYGFWVIQRHFVPVEKRKGLNFYLVILIFTLATDLILLENGYFEVEKKDQELKPKIEKSHTKSYGRKAITFYLGK